MKVLLDECVDRRFAHDLVGHEVNTVPRKGWAGIKNGELLRRAYAVCAISNRMAHLVPLAAGIVEAAAKVSAGKVERVGG